MLFPSKNWHGDEEAALQLAEVVDFEDARIDLVELFLNLGAAALARSPLG